MARCFDLQARCLYRCRRIEERHLTESEPTNETYVSCLDVTLSL